MIKVNRVHIQGNTIRYDYSVSPDIARFFTDDKYFVTYDCNVEAVPPGIAVIPLLANLMPMAWFVGFDIEVDEVDATFYQSLIELKKEFAVHFKQIVAGSTLKAAKITQHLID